MSSKDTGGQAFPCFERGSAGVGPLDLTDPGMTLRDYFAAKAMQSILSLGSGYDYGELSPIFAIPKQAYELADAMLKARQA